MSASHALMRLPRTGCSEPAGDLRLSIFCYQVSQLQQPHSLKQCAFSDLHSALWGCAFRLGLSRADLWTEPSTAQLVLGAFQHSHCTKWPEEQARIFHASLLTARKDTSETMRDCWPSWRSCSTFQMRNLPKGTGNLQLVKLNLLHS